MDSCRTSDLLPQNSSPTCINLEEAQRMSCKRCKHGLYSLTYVGPQTMLKGETVESHMPHLRCDTTFLLILTKWKLWRKTFFLWELQLKRERKPKVFWETKVWREPNRKEKKEASMNTEDQFEVRVMSLTPRQGTCWWHPAPRWNHHIWNSTCPFPGCRPSLSAGRPAERRQAVRSGWRRTPTTLRSRLLFWPARFLSGRAPASSSRSCGPPPNHLTQKLLHHLYYSKVYGWIKNTHNDSEIHKSFQRSVFKAVWDLSYSTTLMLIIHLLIAVSNLNMKWALLKKIP